MYIFLDKFFFVFHSLLIVFNLFGWIWKKTRKANLICLLLTGFSWTVLGIWYGFGYCVCTDWHWQIKRKLGQYDMPPSYVKYLADSYTGMNFDPELIDIVTGTGLTLALTASLLVNILDWKRKSKTTN